MAWKVLGLGVATLDYLALIPHYPKPDEKIRCNDVLTQGGGNCANTLVALSRLGVETTIISSVGSDHVGEKIKTDLDKERVNTSYIAVKGSNSPFSFVAISENDGSRTIFHRGGPEYDLDILPDEIEVILEDFDWLHLDGRFGLSAMKLAKLAKKMGMRISVEAERVGLNAENLFKYADIVFTAKDFHRDYFGDLNLVKHLDRIIEQGSKIAIVTLGKEGALMKTEKNEFKIAADNAKVVDTTGAGDVFIGAFIYGCLNRWSELKCLQFATKVASKNCEGVGGRYSV